MLGEDRFFTVEKLAERWSVSRDAVTALITSGQLVAVNLVRSKAAKKARWRISSEAIADFEASRSTAKPAPAPKSRRTLPTRTGKSWF